MKNKIANPQTATVGNMVLSDAVFRPMLFSTPMVQALLNGTKTQTRRIIKSKHESGLFQVCKNLDGKITSIESLNWDEMNCEKDIYPIANIGDVIWVRETYFDTSNVPKAELFKGVGKYIYKADNAFIGCNNWKPSLFMTKDACRIWLKVTNVRVERLQDISEEDAENEGLEKDYSTFFDTNRQYSFPDYNTPRTEIKRGKKVKISSGLFKYAVDSYKSLWQKINGKDSWDENPFVWVYDFKVIREAPYGFR
jgi:hypothetical protein